MQIVYQQGPISENEAITKIQACSRGFLARNRVFFEKGLLRYLIPHAALLGSSAEELKVQIHEHAYSPDFNPKRDGFPQKDRSLLYIFESAISQEGANKKIRETFGIKIEMGLSPSGYKRKMEMGPSLAIVSLKPSKSQDHHQLENRVSRGRFLHQKILCQLEGEQECEVFFTDKPEEFDTGIFKQSWYPIDLQRALRQCGQRVTLSSTSTYSPLFNHTEALRSIKDVMRALNWLHTHCYVHRDVKSSNVLLSYQNHRFVGHLNDYDWLKEGFGYDELGFADDYPLWDPCAMCNVATPYVDLYGVALLLCRVLSFTDYEELSLQRNQVIEHLMLGLEPNLTGRDSCETAFLHICYESTKVMLHILDETMPLAQLLHSRNEKENITQPIDQKFWIEGLQKIVKKNHHLFTHKALVEAMGYVSKEMRIQGMHHYTMQKLMELIPSTD